MPVRNGAGSGPKRAGLNVWSGWGDALFYEGQAEWSVFCGTGRDEGGFWQGGHDGRVPVAVELLWRRIRRSSKRRNGRFCRMLCVEMARGRGGARRMVLVENDLGGGEREWEMMLDSVSGWLIIC